MENANSAFEELGHVCATHSKESELVCKDGATMKEDSHCGELVQFMWWAARSGTKTEECCLDNGI